MSRRATGPLASAAALSAVLALGGCVERKLVIQSDPPGAIVSLEDEELPGRTPVEVPFEWDGVRRVKLQREGHHVLEATADVEARWYDWFPLDVVAQFLWPGTIEDVRTFDYRLEPYADWRALDPEQRRAVEAQARERMAGLRERADTHKAGGSAGPGGTPPTPEQQERAATSAPKPRTRAERGPPPMTGEVPPPVPPGVELPPPVPPPPLYPPEEPK
jgi:hypothetical protein